MSEQRRTPPSGLVELRVTPLPTDRPAAEEHLGDRIAAFVDGELDHGARDRVQAHLAACERCRGDAEAQRRVRSRLRESPSPAPSSDFLARLAAISAVADSDDDHGRPPASPRDRDRADETSGPLRDRWQGGRSADGRPLDGRGGGPRSLFGSGGLGTGSFGRGGSRFGSGALGADHPIPGVDPRARRALPGEARQRSARQGDGQTAVPAAAPAAASAPAGGTGDGVVVPLAKAVRAPQRSGGDASALLPAAAAAAAGAADGSSAPAAQPQEPRTQTAGGGATAGSARSRRFAFVAAGAFSVAAVALSSALTGVSASETPSGGTVGPAGNYAPAGGGYGYGSVSGRFVYDVQGETGVSSGNGVLRRALAPAPVQVPFAVPSGPVASATSVSGGLSGSAGGVDGAALRLDSGSSRQR